MALPLFKLPMLVIKLILETMGFIEMFLLCNVSSKTNRIFKNLVTIRNHEMLLFLRNNCFVFDFRTQANHTPVSEIHLKPRRNQSGDLMSLNVGNNDVAWELLSVGGRITLVIYSDTSMYDGEVLYRVLFELFERPVQQVSINLNDVAVATFRCWITWNNELFYDTPLLHILGKCSFSNYIWILENVRTRHRLYFAVEPTEYPSNPETVEIFAGGVEAIAILHGRWINIEQLNLLKIQDTTIQEVPLTDIQINRFLRNWRDSGVASNWKKLNIHFNRAANLDIVLEGIDVTDEDEIRPTGVIHQWSFNTGNGEKCTVCYARYNFLLFGFEFRVGN
ncbi:hypothetical protein CAEBREN_01891 [Caenorhabditis brenneri]|uniref:F-box domain-containing protein n=1 Tax=Caenorhabditis brenneri TaxID=135651 RepID=G0NX30_CAEBE|nr:hypothetical protein CAEBREN_01891 [Caenorhabditis brenneri]